MKQVLTALVPVCCLLAPWSAGPALGQTATLKGHRHTVTCLAFSPDGKMLATGGIDRNVSLWDVAGGLKPEQSK